MAKSYYTILGISQNASSGEIKSAYRRLAKHFHPDRYTGGNEMFREIQEAYSVLGDPGRRVQYERSIRRPSGTPSRKGSPPPPVPEPLIPEEPVDFIGDISLTRSIERFTPSFDEVFDWLWKNFSSLERSKSGRIRQLTMEVPLTAKQARNGGNTRILVPARAACPTCRGFGHIGPYTCSGCAGEGVITGEVPVLVSFPAGLTQDHAVMISLDRFGIRNLHLIVMFRPTETDIP